MCSLMCGFGLGLYRVIRLDLTRVYSLTAAMTLTNT
jgi:hypothetical protein